MADGRVVVITGASSGIGAALAVRLGREGHRLVLAARNAEKLRAVAVEAAPEGFALPVPTDVTRRDEVERLRDTALERFGAIDVWVNNAGRGIARPVLELTDEDVDEMIAVNVKSALYGMQAIVPYFVERGRGHVINVSSMLGRLPAAPWRSAYSAAKAALNSLSSNVRMDLRQKGVKDVHVSVVMPGMVSTDFGLNAKHSKGPPPRPAAHMPQPQTVDVVVQVLADLIERPRAEVYTNPAGAIAVQRYVQDVGAFEENMSS
ncbi:MAG TPA: SDR family oxidoreductase [Thermoanaerobaculia bacterium]|nr:SDR family oxidoreductase [Thermoanaerobaculia bacterium]